MGSMKTTLSQLEKWTRRYAKQESDLEAIYAEKQPNELMKGENRLSRLGNIEEAAAVVSQEGLKFIMTQLGNMIGNQVGKEMDKILSQLEERLVPIVRQAVREELHSMLLGMLSGIPVASAKEEPKPEPVVVDKPEPEPKNQEERKRISKDEVVIMAQICVNVLNKKRPRKLRELVTELKAHGYEFNNPSVFFERIRKVEPRIVKSGRGEYDLVD